MAGWVGRSQQKGKQAGVHGFSDAKGVQLAMACTWAAAHVCVPYLSEMCLFNYRCEFKSQFYNLPIVGPQA